MECIITFEEVKSVIFKFKNNKAPGSDNFRIKIIKELWRYSLSVLLNLYNNCFMQKEFLRAWKESNLKIILKDEKRDKSLINSYRPIALLSVIGKIYEKIIVQRIQLAYNEQGLESTR